MWMTGKPRVCRLCVFRHEQNTAKSKEREKRKAKEASREIIKLKTSEAKEIHNNMNPFNYNQMMKVLKDKKLTGFLKIEKKNKYMRKKF
jgi:hypothetical protein